MQKILHQRHSVIFILICFLFSPVLSAISLTNISDEETINYELLLVYGTATNNATEITLINESTGEKTDWPAWQGDFKANILLKEGANELSLVSDRDEVHQFVIYRKLQTKEDEPRFLRPVWAVPSNYTESHYGTFQAPPGEDNSPESGQKRMAFAALMMQAAVAEMMYDAGLGRKTFRVERDEFGEVMSTLHISDQSFTQLQSHKGGSILGELADEMRDYPESQNTLLAISSSVTRYLGGNVYPDANCYNSCSNILAGEAWGRGGSRPAGWTHSGGMHTWPEDITQLRDNLTDTRDLLDFYVYPTRNWRREFWAGFATTFGSLLHEVGHGLGLSHTNGSCGLMDEYYVHANQLFIIEDGDRPYGDLDICLESSTYSILRNSPFLNESDTHTPIARVDKTFINTSEPVEVRDLWGRKKDNSNKAIQSRGIYLRDGKKAVLGLK